MSKWDEAHTEPLHDHPAEKDQLVAAMEAAGYVLDTLESTEDNLRFSTFPLQIFPQDTQKSSPSRCFRSPAGWMISP